MESIKRLSLEYVKSNVTLCTENIHDTPPTAGIGISWRVGSSVRPKILKKCMKLNWNFWRGGEGRVLEKIPFLGGGMDIFWNYGFVMIPDKIGFKNSLTNQDDEVTALFISLFHYQPVAIYLNQNSLMMPE